MAGDKEQWFLRPVAVVVERSPMVYPHGSNGDYAFAENVEVAFSLLRKAVLCRVSLTEEEVGQLVARVSEDGLLSWLGEGEGNDRD